MTHPPPDMPEFERLGHERHRAILVWLFLRRHHGRWFTVEEIAKGTGLAVSTVKSALSRIFGLPPKFRPLLERRVVDDERGRRTEYRFRRIIDIIFER
ncbi:hypothetical protein H5T51_03870 [Candidatus Bathyarchaeota archaeon]|nr:hypothetical protein [Candidatus Bathyarchaeota archaeon]